MAHLTSLTLLPLVIIELLLLVVALVDLIRRDASEVQGGVKWPWVLLILLVGTIGPIVYLLVGRRR